jgi:hypothetical protein
MTRRIRRQPRRGDAAQRLTANVELTLAGWQGWWLEEQASRLSWWQAAAAVHLWRLVDKWRAAAPGTRPALWWVTRGPAWEPESEPVGFEPERRWVEISGRRHWFCGSPWQRCQVDVLAEVGEVTGEELERHRAWVRGGRRFAYPLDEGWSACWIGFGF